MNANKAAFGLTPNDVMQLNKEESDAIGARHLRLKQFYKGFKVEGANYILHYDKKGFLTHSNGILGEEIDDNTNTTASISESQAFILAVSALDGAKPMWLDPVWEQYIRIEKGDSSATYKPKGELLLVLSDNDKYRLAYTFDMPTAKPTGGWQIYIDARNRQVLKKVSTVQSCVHPASFGTTPTPYTPVINTPFVYSTPPVSGCTPVVINFTSMYNGAQTDWARLASFFSNTKCLKNCNNEINSETVHSNGSSVSSTSYSWGTDQQQYTTSHWAVERSWTYFKDKFNRSGWDGNHQKVLTLVDDENFSNSIGSFAFFLGGGSQTLHLFNGFMALDVVGHEFTHGVVDHSSQLGFSAEGGALNESFADIFGILTDFYTTGNLKWQIGGEAPLTAAIGLPLTFLRDLQTPINSFPAGASIFMGANWVNTANPSQANDFGGVHSNCGVQNRWFYLLTNGGTQNGVTVQGIGIDKAALITYNNMVFQLQPGATFQAAANGAVAFARNYYGCASFELEQTRRAWQAVGINTLEPQIMLNGTNALCSDYNNDTNISFDACWRYGANFTWTYPSQYTGVAYGTGDNTLTLTIPAQDHGQIDVTVTGLVNGITQSQTMTVFITNCGDNNPLFTVRNSNKPQSAQFTLSPNPTSEFVDIVLPNNLKNAIFDAEVYNTLGQLMYKKRIDNTNNRLEIAELAKGFYTVILKTPSDKKITFSSKFTKI